MEYIAKNKAAFHEYAILENYEAGIVLTGAEVKSVRRGTVALKGSFAILSGGEIFLHTMHIAHYPPAGPDVSYNPTRTRKLLLTGKEIRGLIGKLKTPGLTLVPLGVYTKAHKIKVHLGLGRGKRQYEKREIIKKKSTDREIRQALKRFR
ncbi:SsrA-binding protein SmpB [Candidatus Uhrbacteria bacterium]|nr:SsrA-binding protein SmpB [Candidatus Uhrbacteria bacterium]